MPTKCNKCKYNKICKHPYNCNTFGAIASILYRLDKQISAKTKSS